MNPTLAELIQNALDMSADAKRIPCSLTHENQQLALNALEERLQELIEAKVNQMLERT